LTGESVFRSAIAAGPVDEGLLAGTTVGLKKGVSHIDRVNAKSLDLPSEFIPGIRVVRFPGFLNLRGSYLRGVPHAASGSPPNT
jgi:hypothetical protein